jgi:hypothetical protein
MPYTMETNITVTPQPELGKESHHDIRAMMLTYNPIRTRTFSTIATHGNNTEMLSPCHIEKYNDYLNNMKTHAIIDSNNDRTINNKIIYGGCTNSKTKSRIKS